MIRLGTAVFLSGAALMGLEIVGSRLLAPTYGTSILVWGALITTFLVSLASGYALGGRVADRRPRAVVLGDLLAMAGALLWVLCSVASELLAATERLPLPLRFRPLAAALLLFAPPSVLMGMATPFAVRLAARDVATIGTSAGRLSALSTAGSILGTFATAFFLIPAFPLRPILYGLGAALVTAALLLVPLRSLRFGFGVVLLLAGVPLFLGGSSDGGTPPPGGRVLLSKETAYHRIRVFEDGRYLSLAFDHLRQGRLPRDPNDPIPASYPDGLHAALALRRTPARSLLSIGLGAGMVPRFVGERMPEVTLTSVEIDPEVVRVAERFFGYRTGPRNRIVVGDGRRALRDERGPFDAVYLDAYFSDSIPFHLLTREFFVLVKERLSRDGVFAANLVGSMCGRDNALFWSAYRTLGTVFPRCYVLSPELRAGRTRFLGNAILVATASPDRVDARDFAARTAALSTSLRRPEIAQWGEWLYEGEAFTRGVPVLSDDYGPTDALQHLR